MAFSNSHPHIRDPIRAAFGKIQQGAGANRYIGPHLRLNSCYGNVEVEEYLPHSPLINKIETNVGNLIANVTVLQSEEYFNSRMDMYLPIHTGNIGGNYLYVSGGFYGNILGPYQSSIRTVGNLDYLNVAGDTVLHGNLALTKGILLTSDLYITGNLLVSGNTTTIDSTEMLTTNRHIVMSARATTPEEALGSGILTPYSKFTYNNLLNSWNSNVNLTPADDDTYQLGNVEFRWSRGWFSNIYGLVITPDQQHITSVGDLTHLNVKGNTEILGDLTVSNVAYAMADYQDWIGNVSTISSALDQLARRLRLLGS